MTADGVGGSVVDTLDDVDLATVWPVWSEKPVSRPKSTGGRRHVCNVCNEKTVVVSGDAGHTDRSTTSRARGEDSGVVDAPLRDRRVRDETLAYSIAVVEIVDESVGSVASSVNMLQRRVERPRTGLLP